MADTLPSGIAVDELSSDIRPQDDLFRHVNSRWMAETEIPPDRAAHGAFHALRDQFEQNRAWIEAAAERVAGRKITVLSVQVESGAVPANGATPKDEPEAPSPNGKRDLKAEAMSSAAVQAVLDVFPGEIKDVEEL